MLVDPLIPEDDAEPFWRVLDREVERAGKPVIVALTAPWHERSTPAVLERYAARLWAHDAARSRLRWSVYAPLPIGLEIRLVPPFHEGQVALFLPAHRALVTAEILADLGTGLRVCPSPALEDQAALTTFLHGLVELPVELLLPAHGPPVVEDARVAIAAALAHYAPSAA